MVEKKINVYKHLWKRYLQCLDMKEYGIANTHFRKLRSGNDQHASSGNPQKLSDALTYSIYSNKRKQNV